MNNVTIRAVAAADIPAIRRIVRDVWDWISLIGDTAVLDAAIRLYFSQVLHEATFGRVAIVGDDVVGVIFGSVNGQPYTFRDIQEDLVPSALTLMCAQDEERLAIADYISKTNAAYEALLGASADEYDGALDFLVLDARSQGLGVGKVLWLALREYFVQRDAKNVYLFSDTECNFGFYEHMGFVRRREQAVTYGSGAGAFGMTQFLYDYRLR